MDSTNQPLDDEIRQLRARVSELERELERRDLQNRASNLEAEVSRTSGRSGGRRRVASDETDVSQTSGGMGRESRSRRTVQPTPVGSRVDESIRDTSQRASDTFNRTSEETRRLIRGLTLASLEPFRVAADVFGSFVDDVYSRNRSNTDAPIEDLIANLPGDIYGGFVNAVGRTLDVIPNAVDTFHSSYHEGSASRKSRQTAVADEEPRIVATTPTAGASGPAPSAITVTFDSSIQPTNQDFSSTVVVRRQGEANAVAGTTTLSGRDTLVWLPKQPLAAGTHTVRVFNVESVPDGYVVPMQTPFIFTFAVISERASGSSRS